HAKQAPPLGLGALLPPPLDHPAVQRRDQLLHHHVGLLAQPLHHLALRRAIHVQPPLAEGSGVLLVQGGLGQQPARLVAEVGGGSPRAAHAQTRPHRGPFLLPPSRPRGAPPPNRRASRLPPGAPPAAEGDALRLVRLGPGLRQFRQVVRKPASL